MIFFRNFLPNVSEYDAVMFHERDIKNPQEIPPKRATKQIYINYNLESPLWEQVMAGFGKNIHKKC